MSGAFGQLLRYGAVGVLSNAFGYLLYLTFTAAGVGPKIAMTGAYAIGVLQAFLFNKRWSFRHDGTATPAFMRYVGAYVLGYLLNLAILWLAVDRLGWPHQWIQAAAVIGIAATLFLLQRYWVFAPSKARAV